MKILWTINIPSPYRVHFFNELGKYCDLTVLFEKRFSDERDDSWQKYQFQNFKGIFLQGFKTHTDSSVCPGVVKYLKKNQYDAIICSNFSFATGMLAIEYMRMKKIPYYLECDGGFHKSGKGFKERVKRHFISGAKGYFTTGKACTEYYETYGAKGPFFLYPFTSVFASDIVSSVTAEAEKLTIRNKLDIPEKKVVLAVGSPIRRKGFDILLKAAARLSEDVGLYFVGGTENAEYRQIIEELQLKNIHFMGFKEPKELADFYSAADVFVLPTRYDIWGLVINEAMAKGLPVITTKLCGAGLELIQDGMNGYLVDVEEPEQLADAISKVLTAPESMGRKSLEIIQKYSIEEMAKAHITYFQQAIS